MQRRVRSGDGVMCAATLGNLGGLMCDNPREHKGGGKGCTYTASDAPDRHDKKEARDD